MQFKPFQSLSLEIKMGLIILAGLLFIFFTILSVGHDTRQASRLRINNWAANYIRHPDYTFSCNEEQQCDLVNLRNNKTYLLDCSDHYCYVREQERRN